MPSKTTLEFINEHELMGASYPQGTTLEVTYNLPAQSRKIVYLGTVAMNPDQKSRQTVVTKKFGVKQILPVAATYTLETETKTFHDYAIIDGELEIIHTVESTSPADLVFDPTDIAFSIRPVLPAPRSN